MRYITTRLLKARKLEEVWIYRTKKGLLSGISYKQNIEPDVVHNGQKWIKPPKGGELVSLDKHPQAYEELLSLCLLYGSKVVGQLLGFDLNSFGDVYNFYFLAGFQQYGQKYVDYLNRIAEIDYNILKFIESHGISRHNDYYYVDKNCYLKAYPFVGQHLESAIFSIPVPPQIDVVRLHDGLEAMLNLCGINIDMSLYDMIKIVADEDSVGWLKNNLEINLG